MTNKLFYRFLSIFFVIAETFTLINGYFFIPLTKLMIFVIIVSIVLYPKSYLSKSTFFLILYLCMICVYSVFDNGIVNLSFLITDIMLPLSCLSLCNVFLYNHDYHGLKIVTIIGITIIVLTSILTIPIAASDPDSVRAMVTYSVEGDVKELQFNQKRGIASFGLVHAFPLIVPLLVYHFKKAQSFFVRISFAITIVVPYYMLIQASFATPLIISTFGLICSFIISKNTQKNLVIFACMLCLLPVAVDGQLVVSGLTEIKNVFSDTPLEEKIKDIMISIEHGSTEGQVGGRGSLYKQSWNSFFHNPLFGISDKTQAGGHAYFADRLAYFGLIGTVPFIAFFVFAFKRFYIMCNEDCKIYISISFFIFMLMAFLKNIYGIENFIYFLVFIPGLSLVDKCKLLNHNDKLLRQDLCFNEKLH